MRLTFCVLLVASTHSSLLTLCRFQFYGEKEASVPPCAHPLCMDCMSQLLDKVSHNRAKTGRCPICRLLLTSDKITYLGQAADADTALQEEEVPLDGECLDRKLPANRGKVSSFGPVDCSLNGFHLTISDVELSVAGASTLRFGQSALEEAELTQIRRDARSELSEVNQSLVRSKYVSER